MADTSGRGRLGGVARSGKGAVRRGLALFTRVTGLRISRANRSIAHPGKLQYSAFALDAVVGAGDRGTLGRFGFPPSPLGDAALLEGRYLHPRFVDHTEVEHPPVDAVFVTVCNDKYAPGLEALLLSLLRVYPDLSSRFRVYHDGNLSPLNQERLAGIYPRVEFRQDDPARYAVTMADHYNHRRVGLLGYLSLDALGIEDASYAIILDTDLLILGDISPLWKHESVAAVADMGERPYGIVAASTGAPILNSGVLSLARSERGPEAVARAERVLAHLDSVTDPDLARFADQKFWNVYLAERDVVLLPQNFNAIKTLVARYFPEELGSVKILHLTGPKPWYSFLSENLLTDEDNRRYSRGRREFREAFALWNSIYRSELARSRTDRFRREQGARLESLRGTIAGRPCVLIGNGPSIARTDMTVFDGYEKVAFNWFVLHEEFDRVRPDHLVLPSHMFFGGWHTARPEMPETFLTALLAKEHRPRLWISYYFKPYIETLEALKDYEIDYFLFEKPLKRRIAQSGLPQLDLLSPLADCNTGVLTAGVPIALHLGAETIVLVGCDANYGSASGSYFYRSDQHASATTREESLLATWEQDGEGSYGYRVTRDALALRGIGFLDSTVDGRLTVLPKLPLEQARGLSASGHHPADQAPVTA